MLTLDPWVAIFCASIVIIWIGCLIALLATRRTNAVPAELLALKQAECDATEKAMIAWRDAAGKWKEAYDSSKQYQQALEEKIERLSATIN